jgi:cytochrome c oxidase subunit 1
MTFAPQFVIGTQGGPRRYHEYLPEQEIWHQMSSYGSFLFGASLFAMLGYLIHSLVKGEDSPQNPWGGVSMEWETATPPIEHNFVGQPICTHGPYDFDKVNAA